jgi:pyrroloquinoline quinone biosynthesis protein E
VKDLGFPLTMNTVFHRENLDHIDEVIALAEELEADRLELANAQYLGWALLNRTALLPGAAQIERARSIAAAARARLQGRMEIVFVVPDYYGQFPPPCMDGWGRRFMVVSPDGLLLPCLLAHTLPGLSFGSVRERSVQELWTASPGLEAFRGEAWMPEPCKSCARRGVDFGGCRCQAWHLTGNAAATDPACSLSPDHGLIEEARAAALSPEIVTFRYREARPPPKAQAAARQGPLVASVPKP